MFTDPVAEDKDAYSKAQDILVAEALKMIQNDILAFPYRHPYDISLEISRGLGEDLITRMAVMSRRMLDNNGYQRRSIPETCSLCGKFWEETDRRYFDGDQVFCHPCATPEMRTPNRLTNPVGDDTV